MKFIYQAFCLLPLAAVGGSIAPATGTTTTTTKTTRTRTLRRRRPTTPSDVNNNHDDCTLTFQMESTCHDAVNVLSNRTQGLALPNHFQYPGTEEGPPEKQEGDFDVARYMDVLDYLTLPLDLTLDYVYDSNGGGGYTIIYVRSIHEQPFATVQEYRDASCPEGQCPQFIQPITAVGNYPQGYMQLAVLHVMAEQFYLWWHALFNDYQIIYNQATLTSTLRQIESEVSYGDCGALSDEEMDQARALHVDPLVTYNVIAGEVRASLVVFSKWGGFYRKSLIVTSSGTRVDYENLIRYNVCWLY